METLIEGRDYDTGWWARGGRQAAGLGLGWNWVVLWTPLPSGHSEVRTTAILSQNVRLQTCVSGVPTMTRTASRRWPLPSTLGGFTRLAAGALTLVVLGCRPTPDATKAVVQIDLSTEAVAAIPTTAPTPPHYGAAISLAITGVLGGDPIGVGGQGQSSWIASYRALRSLDLSDPAAPVLGSPELFPVPFWQLLEHGDAVWASDGNNGIWRRPMACRTDCWSRVWRSSWVESATPQAEDSVGLNFAIPPGAMAGEPPVDIIRGMAAPRAVADTIVVLTEQGLRVLHTGNEVSEVAFLPRSDDNASIAGLEVGDTLIGYDELTSYREADPIWRVHRVDLADPARPIVRPPVELPHPGPIDPTDAWSAMLADGRVVLDGTTYDWGLSPDFRKVTDERVGDSTWSNLVDARTTVLITSPVESALVLGSKVLYLSPGDDALQLLDATPGSANGVATIGRIPSKGGRSQGDEAERRLVGAAGDVVVIAPAGPSELGLIDLQAPEAGVVASLPWPTNCERLDIEAERLGCSLVSGSGSTDFDGVPLGEWEKVLGLPHQAHERRRVSSIDEDASEYGVHEGYSTWPVVRKGDHVFRLSGTDQDGGVMRIESMDISGAGEPRVVDELGPIQGFAWPEIVLFENTLYLVPGPGHGDSEFLIVDISDPTHLRTVARKRVDEFTVSPYGSPPRQLPSFPGLVFVPSLVYDGTTGTWADGLTILDVRDGANLRVIGKTAEDIGYITDIEEYGDHHLIVAGGGMLYGLRLTFDSAEERRTEHGSP